MFDKDKSGTISPEEIMIVLSHGGKNFAGQDHIWNKIVEEVDVDGNGEVDFEEFCVMMEKMLQTSDDLMDELDINLEEDHEF